MVIGTGADQIVITVVEISENKARLGIVAPRELPVHRDEIYKRICDEQASEEEKGGDG